MKLPIAIASALSAGALALALSSSPQQGGVWSVDFDDPNRAGTQTTEITVTYIDSVGKKQEKKISATTTIDPAWDAARKKSEVQAKLDSALADAANQVGGQALASTGGLGDVMQAAPNQSPTGTPPPFSDAKIKKVETTDKGTGENDAVNKPAQSAQALGSIAIGNDISGVTADNLPSVFSVITNVGVIDVSLAPGQTRLEVLDLVAAELAEQNADVWVDSDLLLLFVTLDSEIYSLGAGSTDATATAIASVRLR